MKRAAVFLICEKNKKNIDYLIAIRDAFAKINIESCFMAGSAEIDLSQKPTDMLLPRSVIMSDVVAHACEQKMSEIIILTDAFMGPVFPLDEFADKLNCCSAPIWRLTRDSHMYGFKPETWKKLSTVTCFNDIVQICSAEGETPELYDTSDIANYSIKPMTTEPLRIICEKRCPFFVHELFHASYAQVLRYSLGYQAPNFYRWLCGCKYWDVNHLWNYLLPSCHQDEYYWNMHLRYVLPTRHSDKAWLKAHLAEHKIALVMHLYYQDKFAESASFAKRFPEGTHVIITTNSEEKKEILTEILKQEGLSSFDVRVIENRGRDVSALLVGIADVYDRFDYICFFHDKKTLQTKPGTIGEGFAYKLEENLFGTADYVNNIIKLFAENPRLGILSPPIPHHAAYFFTMATDWGVNYENTERLLKDLEYTAPISEKHMPIAPLGTCFWFRAKAMEPLFAYGWNYLDFPPEPNNIDGTILHAVERLYPYASVEAGYYPAIVMTDRYAKIEYTNMRYYVEGYNLACINHGIINTQKNMKDRIVSVLQEQ